MLLVSQGDIKAARLPRTQEFSNQYIFYKFIDLLHCNIITQVTIYTIMTYMYPQYYCTNYCKHYGISDCTSYQIVLDQFIRGPDDDSKESKHVARKWQNIINLLCFDGNCISLLTNANVQYYFLYDPRQTHNKFPYLTNTVI